MKIGVVGSRTYIDYERMSQELNEIENIEEIISGGAKGADELAERYAKEKHIKIKIFHPDWMKYGKEAGKLRNDDIVKESDMIVAFWDMESPGTKDTITKAENLCKPIRIIQFDNKKDDKLCFEENNDELYIYGKDTYHLKDEIKKIGEDIGLKLPRGKIIEIRSTLGEGSSELRGPYQPLSPKKLGKLVGELNKQRNVFIEGEVGQFLSSMGKERR